MSKSDDDPPLTWLRELHAELQRKNSKWNCARLGYEAEFVDGKLKLSVPGIGFAEGPVVVLRCGPERVVLVNPIGNEEPVEGRERLFERVYEILQERYGSRISAD